MPATALIATLLIALAAPALARPLPLSLQEAMAIALEKNLGLQSAHLQEEVRQTAIRAEAARFGRSLSTSLAYQSDRAPSFSALEQVRTSTSSNSSASLGLAQELRTGGRLSVDFGNSRSSSNAAFRTIDPVYRSDLQLRLTQPLLRGAGSVNTIPLELAHSGLEGARLQTRAEVRDLRAQVGQAYWDLYLAGARLNVEHQLAEGARRVLETVRARAEMGTSPLNSILEAEVDLARREETLVVAEGALRAAEDRLRTRCGLDRDPGGWSLDLQLTDEPGIAPFDAELEAGIERALALSSEYRRAELALRDLDLQLALARDRTRPALDLNLRFGLNGIGGNYSDNVEVLRESDGRSWQSGLSLSMPLGQSSEGAQQDQRRLEKERSAIDLEALRLQIVQQTRERHRQVHIARRRTEVAALAADLAERHVTEQENRLALGLATARQVLDAQDDLAQSRANQLQAVVDYNKALIEWQRLIGE